MAVAIVANILGRRLIFGFDNLTLTSPKWTRAPSLNSSG
jgi:hypothetical protein